MSQVNLFSLSHADAVAFVQRLGWPSYRATQTLKWLYQRRVRDIAAMTNVSLADRAQLQEVATITRAEDVRVLADGDGTSKILMTLSDGLQVESVLIPDGDRLTLCVSTQVGCTLDCSFCLTGTMGLKRNLKAHEIVEQLLAAQEHLPSDRRVTSLVLMGMGEPLANLEEVSEAIERLSNTQWGLGFSRRRMTLSTAGLATRMPEVVKLGVNLAVSINATTNAQRDRLMPAVNRLHSLEELLDTCRAYPLPSGRRLTCEYVLLAGENDTLEDAKRLRRLLNGIRCKVNLIPFNEFPGSRFRRPSEDAVHQFQSVLRGAGLDVFIRKSRGREVLGACGQLGGEEHAPPVAGVRDLPILHSGI